MEIDLNKTYVTRDHGFKVELYKRHDRGDYPIIGAYLPHDQDWWIPMRWSVTGHSSNLTALRLKEVDQFEILECSAYVKIVDYFGASLVIPKTVNWLATDWDGSVFGYASKPYASSSHSKPAQPMQWCNGLCSRIKIANINFNGDHKNSLVEV